MSAQATAWRTRLRFRVQKKLSIKEPEYLFKIGVWDAKLSAQSPDTPINQSDWLIVNVRGVPTEDVARNLGQDLKAALQVSSAASRQGIDAGIDLPTSGIGESIREKWAQDGILIRDNVHGVDAFPDAENVSIINISATGSVSKQPDPFLSDLGALLGSAGSLSKDAANVILLLNFALMRSEPVAQIVFSISAVEMLGQTQNWSADQRRLLGQLRKYAEDSDIGSAEEREEVATAVSKSLHRLSLRQGVRRLLDSLGLQHLRKQWDSLYEERSKLGRELINAKPQADGCQLHER